MILVYLWFLSSRIPLSILYYILSYGFVLEFRICVLYFLTEFVFWVIKRKLTINNKQKWFLGWRIVFSILYFVVFYFGIALVFWICILNFGIEFVFWALQPTVDLLCFGGYNLFYSRNICFIKFYCNWVYHIFWFYCVADLYFVEIRNIWRGLSGNIFKML